MQIKSSQALAKPCSKADESANHDYILQRHANQELLSSRQTLLREQMNQQEHVYIIQNANRSTQALPNSAQGANELAKPRLTSNMQPLGLLPETLLRERIISKTTFYKCASQEHSSSCKTLHSRDQQDHVYIIQTCKHLGSCQTLLRERIASKTTFTR